MVHAQQDSLLSVSTPQSQPALRKGHSTWDQHDDTVVLENRLDTRVLGLKS